MIDLPSDLLPSAIMLRELRPSSIQSSPVSGIDIEVSSAFSKFTAELEYPESRARLARAFFGSLGKARKSNLRIPLCTSAKASGTASLVASGIGDTLTVTVAGTGASSRAVVNGGVGFRRGDMLSYVQDGRNYAYMVEDPQTTDFTVKLTSRLRGGTLPANTPISYNPAFLVGRVASEVELSWQPTNLYGFSVTVVERR